MDPCNGGLTFWWKWFGISSTVTGTLIQTGISRYTEDPSKVFPSQYENQGCRQIDGSRFYTPTSSSSVESRGPSRLPSRPSLDPETTESSRRSRREETDEGVKKVNSICVRGQDKFGDNESKKRQDTTVNYHGRLMGPGFYLIHSTTQVHYSESWIVKVLFHLPVSPNSTLSNMKSRFTNFLST